MHTGGPRLASRDTGQDAAGAVSVSHQNQPIMYYIGSIAPNSTPNTNMENGNKIQPSFQNVTEVPPLTEVPPQRPHSYFEYMQFVLNCS
jgi:hypothetical protein